MTWFQGNKYFVRICRHSFYWRFKSFIDIMQSTTRKLITSREAGSERRIRLER